MILALILFISFTYGQCFRLLVAELPFLTVVPAHSLPQSNMTAKSMKVTSRISKLPSFSRKNCAVKTWFQAMLSAQLWDHQGRSLLLQRSNYRLYFCKKYSLTFHTTDKIDENFSCQKLATVIHSGGSGQEAQALTHVNCTTVNHTCIHYRDCNIAQQYLVS